MGLCAFVLYVNTNLILSKTQTQKLNLNLKGKIIETIEANLYNLKFKQYPFSENKAST